MKYLRLGVAILIAGVGAKAAQADQTQVAYTGYFLPDPIIHYDFTTLLNSEVALYNQLSASTFSSYNFNIGSLSGQDVVAASFRGVPALNANFSDFRIDPNTVTVTQVVHPLPQTWTLAAVSGAKVVFKKGAYLIDFGNVLTDSSNAALLKIANTSAPVDGETLNGGFFAPKYEGGLDFRRNLPQSPFDIGGGQSFNFAFGFETAGLTAGDYYSSATLDTSRYLSGDAVTGDTFTSVSVHARVVDVLPVAGVPEPAAWTMMIAGFGLVGSALRRRTQQVV